MTDTLSTNDPAVSPLRLTKTQGGNVVPTDHIAQPWAIRTTLIAVAELDRSVAFYREPRSFEEIFRAYAVAVLGGTSANT